MEPALASAARPLAEAIASAQAAADVARHPDRYSSDRQVKDEMERLQPRGDLPPVPTLEPGGDPDLWRSTPVVVIGPDQAEQVLPKLRQLEASIDREAYEQAPPAPDWDEL